MAYELIISEKPDAARRIAESLADKKAVKKTNNKVPYYELKHSDKPIVVACAVGHLYTVAEKDKSFTYPSFDIQWIPAAQANKKAEFSKKYLNTIKKLAKDADSFTVACDYDVEGEVIGLNTVRFACKQEDARRMKFSTLTKDELRESYNKSSPHIDWGLANAGEARHFMDWMYGINISRALTLAVKSTGAFKILSSGRVQGPALKILYDKEKEIQAFRSEPYWQILLIIEKQGKTIEALHHKGKFFNHDEAKACFEKALWQKALLKNIEKKEFSQNPPFPFDLGSLQSEAYKLFRINPKETLGTAQALYTAGLISYPRTSSQKLPKKIDYKKILQSLANNDLKYKEKVSKLLGIGELSPNQGKKTDPAHPAIYPTGLKPKKLKPREEKIYDLIVKRFFATFGKPAVRETQKISIDVGGELFEAKGTKTRTRNWFELYHPYVRLKEEEWPVFVKGEELKVKNLDKQEKETQPPKRYTPASIISELEKRGLGTKATRADIVDSLYKRKYIAEQSIKVTDMGMSIIQTLQKYIPNITDQELTRHFEEEMKNIRKNKISKKEVLEEAKQVLTRILDDFKKNEKQIGEELKKAHHQTLNKESYVCKCPNCDGNLRIKFSRKGRKRVRFIACDKYPECKTTFAIPQTGLIKGTEKKCPECGQPIIQVIQKGKRPQEVCLNKECPAKKTSENNLEVKEENGLKTIGRKCPKCGKDLVLRKSIYGEFIGCSGYPKCRYTENIEKEKK